MGMLGENTLIAYAISIPAFDRDAVSGSLLSSPPWRLTFEPLVVPFGIGAAPFFASGLAPSLLLFPFYFP